MGCKPSRTTDLLDIREDLAAINKTISYLVDIYYRPPIHPVRVPFHLKIREQSMRTINPNQINNVESTPELRLGVTF